MDKRLLLSDLNGGATQSAGDNRLNGGAPPPAGDDRLPEIIKEIKTAHRNFRGSALRTAKYAIETGRLLNEAKQLTGHGRWRDWVGRNCPFTQRTAELYMRIAKRVAKRELKIATVADLGIQAAAEGVDADTTPGAMAFREARRQRLLEALKKHRLDEPPADEVVGPPIPKDYWRLHGPGERQVLQVSRQYNDGSRHVAYFWQEPIQAFENMERVPTSHLANFAHITLRYKRGALHLFEGEHHTNEHFETWKDASTEVFGYNEVNQLPNVPEGIPGPWDVDVTSLMMLSDWRTSILIANREIVTLKAEVQQLRAAAVAATPRRLRVA